MEKDRKEHEKTKKQKDELEQKVKMLEDENSELKKKVKELQELNE